MGWVEELPSGRFRGVARTAVSGKRFTKTFDRYSEADAYWRRTEDEIVAAYQTTDDMDISSADPAYDFIVKTLIQLETFGLDANDPNTIRRAVLHGRAVHRLVARVQQQKEAVRPIVLEGVEVVYYVRIGNRCKIGYTANMQSRMAKLNPEEILAIEPGYLALERIRHEEFAQLRTHGEWFRLEEPLTSRIGKLRADWQPPWPGPLSKLTPSPRVGRTPSGSGTP